MHVWIYMCVCIYTHTHRSNYEDIQRRHTQGLQNPLREIRYFVNLHTKKKDEWSKSGAAHGRGRWEKGLALWVWYEERARLSMPGWEGPVRSSFAQSCPTLCDSVDCSTTGLTVFRHLPELAQTHVRWFGDAIQPSYPLQSPSPPAFNLSQHQGLF